MFPNNSENTSPGATASAQVYIGHAWQRDVEAGDGPVYITLTLPRWLPEVDGIGDCTRCASRLAITDAPEVRGYLVAHQDGCSYLAGLIARGIADGVLDRNGEVAA